MDESHRSDALQRLLGKHGFDRAAQVPLPGDASFRRYIRLTGGPMPAMVMDAPSQAGEDCTPFVAIAEHLVGLDLSAPRILGADLENGFLILEDLGDDLFARVLIDDVTSLSDAELYEAAIDVLCHLRHRPPLQLGGYHLPAYDDAVLHREAGLLSEWYLPLVHGARLPSDIDRIWHGLWDKVFETVRPAQEILVLRDYHAENLFWLPQRSDIRRVGLIDFQDGLLGDPAYDLVSLLEDARRDVSPALAEKMQRRYLDQTGLPPETFTRVYDVLAAQRNAKIVGIFARLSERDGKRRYLDLIPRVMALLLGDVRRQSVLAPIREFLDRYIPADAMAIPPKSLRHAS